MLNKRNIGEFSKDLLHAYVLTGRSEVENCFIRIAQSISEIFPAWLANNKLNKLSGKILNPRVIQAFKSMFDIQSKFGANPAQSDIVTYVMNSGSTVPVGIILGFREYLGDPVMGSILGPFASVISAFSIFEDVDIVDSSQDLNIIANSFNRFLESRAHNLYGDYIKPKKEHKRRKDYQEEMFDLLIQDITELIQKDASQLGFTELASALTPSLLLNPTQLSQYIQLGQPGANLAELFKGRLLPEILKKYSPTYRRENLNRILEEIGHFKGRYTEAYLKEMSHKRMLWEMDRKYSVDSAGEYPVAERQQGMLISQDVLAAIVLFFMMYFKKLRSS